jgi:hypothetical protein
MIPTYVLVVVLATGEYAVDEVDHQHFGDDHQHLAP